MIIKLTNTTDEEIVLRENLFRESGEDNDNLTIDELTRPLWGNDADTQLKILDGSIVVSINDVDITDVNQAINFLKNIPNDLDITGRPIVRYAATVKGWHYQAHSVQFEVNKLGSVYNKDKDGNDLGFAELKIYDDNGDECTTQGSADTDGVKTVLTWKPDFDFEIISGHVRQLQKETVDSYVYVTARIATGLAAPNDWLDLPFVQGGVNLNYIGADEPLKTDGRASKLVRGSNGDHFEIVCNYEADLLTNENRHKMSIVFEIYKDPLV